MVSFPCIEIDGNFLRLKYLYNNFLMSICESKTLAENFF